MRYGATIAGLLAAVLSAAPVWSAPRIAVTEDAGTARVAQPITVGMPFPRGWLAAQEIVHLAGGAAAIPAQQRVLSRWPDGSVRWLLLDFRVDLAPRQRLDLTVAKGPTAPPATPVTVVQRGADVEIDTGMIRLLAGKGSGGLFKLRALGGKDVSFEPVRGELDVGAGPVAAPSPDEVVIEERGPQRAALSLRGRWPNGFAYDIRLEAFAGRADVRVLHTIVNAATAPYTPLRRLALRVPAALGAEVAWKAELEGTAPWSGRTVAKAVELEQVDAATARRDGERTRGRLSGRFAARGAKLAVGLEAPFFWQEFPQAVRIAPDGVVYDLWSPAQAPAEIGVGAAKTHELTLSFASQLDGLPALRGGVVAAPDPSWIAASGALPNSIDPLREPAFVAEVGRAFDRYRLSVDSEAWDEAGACEPNGVEIRRLGFYGMLNWGDWNYRGYHDSTKGCDAWGNQEYDLTQVLGLLFATSGRADVRSWWTAAARHYAEVDRIHFQPLYPQWVGMNHPKNPQHFSFRHGGVDLGHTWVEGLFTYHFISGEPRALAAATGIADFLVRRQRTAVRGNPRQFGWPAIALVAAYEATGDARYRQAALDYARAGIAQHGVEKVGTDWKIAILAEALTYVHEMSGDPSLRQWLLRYADAVLERSARDVRYYPAVAYVGRIEGNPRLAEAARAAAGRIIFGDWGKPFTIGSRVGFRILAQSR